QLVKKWNADEASRRAAALAFYTFLALAPLLIIMVSILGLIYGKSGAEADIIEQAQSAVGPSAASALKTVIENAASPRGGIIGVIAGGALLVLGASGIFSELQTDLRVILDVRDHSRRRILNKVVGRLFTFVALLGVGLLLLVSLAAGALISGFAHRLGARSRRRASSSKSLSSLCPSES
ncbi:MAG: YhjD/YihY/BrkB family envelope integrity protein, partial [bacterium]